MIENRLTMTASWKRLFTRALPIWGAMALALSGCFDPELREIRLQAQTAYLFLLPANADTTATWEVPSAAFYADWDSVLLEAGVPAGQIHQAVPLAAIAWVPSLRDSSLVRFDSFEMRVPRAAGDTLLLATFQESGRRNLRPQPLFAPDGNYWGHLQAEDLSASLRFRRTWPLDTLWQVQVEVLWELRGLAE
jgi:hypothetical protein